MAKTFGAIRMIEDELITRLKNLPQEHPFPGVHLVIVRERPLIKALALLTGCWEALVGAMIVIKTSSKDGCRCGTAFLMDVDRPDVNAWILVDAMAVDGQLTKVVMLAAVADPGSEKVSHEFGVGLMRQFKAAAKEIPDVKILYKEDLQ